MTYTDRKPYRVLHVLGSLEGGGIQTVVLNLLGHARSTDIQIDILAMTDREGNMEASAQQLGSTIYHLPLASNPIGFQREFYRIARQYDAVHVHRSSMIQGIPLQIARTAGVKTRIAHFHNIDKSESDSLLRKLSHPFLKKRVLASATHIVGVSSAVLKSQFPRQERSNPPFLVIPNGIDVDYFTKLPDPQEARARLNIDKEGFVVCHAGRFSEAKNHLKLLDAFKFVAETLPEAKLILAGDGEMRLEIEKKIAEAKLNDRVFLIGWQEDIRPVFAAANVFFFPSLWEGFPMALLEAMASGLPCVASDIPSHREALPDKLWAIRCPVNNVRRAVNVLVDLARTPERRAALGSLARQHVREFDTKVVADELFRLYGTGRG